jgi:hypothetical protein
MALALGVGQAETFKLNNGDSISGEVLLSSANDNGVQIKVGDGKYERVAWSSFSQEDLKKFAENKKLEPLVESFIEITQEEKIQRTEVPQKAPPRLELPPKQSLIGAMLGSAPGIFILVLVWAASIFAGYEVHMFRGHSLPLVCGVSAVLPILGPLVFLCIPTKVKPVDSTEEGATAGDYAPAGTVAAAAVTAAATAASAAAAGTGVNPMLDEKVEHPAGLRLAHEEAPKPEAVKATTYQRGQFTFNRRFIETKFPGFFGTIKRDADKDMVLAIKTPRGNHVGHRITRIAANDMHIEERQGAATKEVQIHFQEIQEITLKHKDA